MVMFPEVLLHEMIRISKNVIISFPNFAHITNRLELLFKGRMPQSMLFGYKWYNTGHIHQLSLKDFECRMKELEMDVKKIEHICRWKFFANILFPNFFSKEAIYLCQKKV